MTVAASLLLGLALLALGDYFGRRREGRRRLRVIRLSVTLSRAKIESGPPYRTGVTDGRESIGHVNLWVESIVRNEESGHVGVVLLFADPQKQNNPLTKGPRITLAVPAEKAPAPGECLIALVFPDEA